MAKTEKGIKLGKDLRAQRETAGLKAKDAVEALKRNGFGISVKALYSYETGERIPNADTFIALCDVYKTDDILSAFGYVDNSEQTKKAPDIIAESKYQSIIDLLDKLTFEQVCRAKGYIERMAEENEAAENAAKQITDVG